jgi:hypothetical protein
MHGRLAASLSMLSFVVSQEGLRYDHCGVSQRRMVEVAFLAFAALMCGSRGVALQYEDYRVTALPASFEDTSYAGASRACRQLQREMTSFAVKATSHWTFRMRLGGHSSSGWWLADRPRRRAIRSWFGKFMVASISERLPHSPTHLMNGASQAEWRYESLNLQPRADRSDRTWMFEHGRILL